MCYNVYIENKKGEKEMKYNEIKNQIRKDKALIAEAQAIAKECYDAGRDRINAFKENCVSLFEKKEIAEETSREIKHKKGI